ncbi:hypothetical protein AB0L76_17615 [Nonomuraea fuscirosea]
MDFEIREDRERTRGRRALARERGEALTDLAAHTRDQLDTVAAELNARPGKTLDWDTPAERLAKLLATCA